MERVSVRGFFVCLTGWHGGRNKPALPYYSLFTFIHVGLALHFLPPVFNLKGNKPAERRALIHNGDAAPPCAAGTRSAHDKFTYFIEYGFIVRVYIKRYRPAQVKAEKAHDGLCVYDVYALHKLAVDVFLSGY
jgi:hypothetical protein